MTQGAPFGLDFEWPAQIYVATYHEVGFWTEENDIQFAIAATNVDDLAMALAVRGHKGMFHPRSVSPESLLDAMKGCPGTVPVGIMLFGPCGVEIARRYAR